MRKELPQQRKMLLKSLASTTQVAFSNTTQVAFSDTTQVAFSSTTQVAFSCSPSFGGTMKSPVRSLSQENAGMLYSQHGTGTIVLGTVVIITSLLFGS